MRASGGWRREKEFSDYVTAESRNCVYSVSKSYTGLITEPCKKESSLPSGCLSIDRKGLCVWRPGWYNACEDSAQNLLSVQAGHLLSSHQLNHTLYCLFKRFICHLRSFLGRGRTKGINLGLMFTSKCERSSLAVPWAPGT